MLRADVRFYVLILASGLALNGQDFRAAVTGRVTDPTGAAVPAARVTVVQWGTNAAYRTLTTETGDYVVPQLIPGEYRLEIERTGFRKSVQEGIVLRVGDRVSVDVVLQVGEQTERVTITAEVPLLEASTASLGEVIPPNTVADMPLNGRSPYSLIQLVPGAMSAGRQTWDFFNRLTTTSAVSGLTVGGSPTGSSEVLLDGVPLTNNSDTEMYTPSVNVTQEFKVQTNTFDAEVGRILGAVVNVSTKSGTNEFHGELDEFLRNSALNARDFFAAYKPKFAYNQFAGSAGGPLSIPGIYSGRNRTFIFGSYEGSREGVPRSYVSTVPTELERCGDFTQTYTLTGGQPAAVTVYDPATTRQSGSAFVRDAFPGNAIPSSRLNPVALKVGSLIPLPTSAGVPVTHANNLPMAYVDGVRDDGFFVRIDHRFSDRHQVFGRVSYRYFDVWGLGGFRNDLTGSHNVRYIPGFGLDDNFTVNPRTVLNLRYGFQRMRIDTGVNLTNLDLTTLGLPAALSKLVDTPGFPYFSISGYASFGVSANYTAWNTHSWHAGLLTQFASHSLRFGADLRVGDTLWGPGGTNCGSYSFNNGFTRGPNPQVTSVTAGSGMASFLLGAGASGSLSYTASYAERVPYYGFYFQDDVRVTPKLTVNLGIRYEWEGGHTERYNRMNRGFDTAAASPIEAQAQAKYAASQIPELPASQFRVKGGLLFAGVNGLPRGLTSIDRNNIAPRAGVAWTLNRKTVLRAGWGLFFGPTSNEDAATRYGFSASTSWVTTMDGGLTPFDTLSNPFPMGSTPPSGSALGLATLLGQSVGFIDVDRRQLYAQRFQFSIQRQLAGQILVESAYVGMRGGEYPVTVSINPVPDQFRTQARATFVATGRNTLNDIVANPFTGLIASGTLSGATTTRGQLLVPYPQFTGVTRYGDTIGSSQYDSFQLKASKRLRSGLSLLLGYTLSKSLGRTSYLNATDTTLCRALSAFDIPQRIVFSGSYALPLGKGHRLCAGCGGPAGKLAEGWQMNWTYSAQSGVPLAVSSAESVGRSAALPKDQRSLQRWFDTSAFRLRQTLELVGTSMLPDVRSQGRNNLNLSLLKDTSVTERAKLQFRAESFNLLNRTEFSNPNMTLGNSAFGTISGQINFARQVQLALRLTW